ncbi:hypothetical protein B0T20DRAFT_480569 [Sordaria brevicollis]|uniref:NWD NACHT-NTPase N-terminal domain-containing protein n=1 Tax=Sordaria brevicollis TaxID=83679 RepID=A0AAE0UAH0_SORBR|nr:hypothetical protein B0T20DRAFT_480569 [Sordaria brevicollis]
MGLKEVKKLLRREAAPPTTGDAKPSSNFNAQTATTTSLFGRLWRQKNGKLGGKVQSQLSSSNEIPRKGTESEIRETAFQLQQRRRPSTTNLKQNLECPPVDKPADDGPSYKPSLWDRAYDTLRKDDAQLLEDYEALVSREVHSSDVDHVYDPQPQRPLRPTTATLNGSEQPRLQMQTIIDRGLRKAEDGMTTRGDSALGGTAQFLRSIKGFITQAVSASPEASVAWAAVCLVLPLFTNHFDAEEANHEGFTYSIHRMQYYSALEPLVFEQDGHLNPSLREAMEKSFVTLYKILLEFQIRTALRFSETTARTVLKETFLPDTWKELRASIDKAEAVLKQDLEQVNMAALLLEAKNQNELSKQQAVALEQLFPLGEAASQTAQTAKEQLQTEQAILTAVDEQTKFQQAEAQRKDQQKMSEQEMRCLQRLRLTDTDTYEVTKDRVDTHVEADPGCGKSVLTKYLVDHHLPRELVTICYFFFKEPHQTKVTQALCAILHQLFANKSALFKKYAMDQLSKDPEGVVKTPSSLWDIFWRAVCDPGAGSITVVMDALDECDPSDLKVFLAPYLRKSIGETINTKFLFTTRPYESITVQFDHLQYVAPSYVRILGEDKCQEISKEVNLVIEHRVEEFAREKKLHTELKTKLREMLLKIEHRTYLWVALLFDDLRYQSLKKTAEGIETAIKTLPTSVNQAYEKLLSRSTEHVTVRRTLSYILAAKRPLTVAEMKVALNTRAGILPKDDDEPEEDFRDRLRQMCGLFISFYQDSVYFFHQTAREFLLTHHQVDNSAVISPDHFDTQWQSSISIFHAHAELGRTCVQFLDLLIKDDFWGFGQKEVTASTYTFYYYSRHNWSRHYRRSNGALDADAEFLTAVKSLCNPQTPGFLDFFNWGESGIPTQLFYRGKMDEASIWKLSKTADTKRAANGQRYALPL